MVCFAAVKVWNHLDERMRVLECQPFFYYLEKGKSSFDFQLPIFKKKEN